LLFGFRANFADIYWSFGFIFELLAALLMFLVLLIHSRKERSYGAVAAIWILTILAIKSKEMAITLPAVLLLYNLFLRPSFDRFARLQYLGLAAITVWFAKLKVLAEAGASPDQPYYMDLSVLTLGRGYGWYFDRLYDVRLRWGAWISISVLLLLWMLYKRE